MAGQLIHVDGDLVVISKPAGVSLATRRSEPGAAVQRLLATLSRSDQRRCGDAAELHLVHRLDVGTTGLVALARSQAVHRRLSRLLAERRVEKTYLALVWGRPRPAEGRWDRALGPDRKDRRRMRADETGKPAVSLYRVLGRAPHVSLLELRPLTGRTHQLRVHCACAGHPIVGDDLYGGPRERGVRDREVRQRLTLSSPLLHAWRLRIPFDEDAGTLALVAPLPEEFTVALSAVGIDPPRE